MTTNDPSHPKVNLVCKGTILEALHLDKRSVNLGRISRSSPEVTKTIVITRGDAGPLKPKLLPRDDLHVKVALKEIEAGEKYALEVTMKPPFPSDSLRTKVQIETGVAEDPTVIIPVYAAVTPRVAARPNRIVVPTRADANWKQAVRLKWDVPEPHKIVSASVTDPSIVARVTGSENSHEVVVALASAEMPTAGNFVLTIVTDDAKMPEIKVPITIGRKRSRPGIPRNVKGAKIDNTRGRAHTPDAKAPAARVKGVAAQPKGAVRPKPAKSAGG